MVAIQRHNSSRKMSHSTVLLLKGALSFAMLVSGLICFSVMAAQERRETDVAKARSIPCVYKSLQDLGKEERYPRKGARHMVQPPEDTILTLVCCSTTKGPWSIVVHHAWAPLGAARFLEMVRSNYFSPGVPLFRCIEEWLCQFGITNSPPITAKFGEAPPFSDDPNWLPEGPEHRENEFGVKRFAKGYLGYAGYGKDSRTNQFIVSLHDEEDLAGGSPWEVPWGELVGDHSYRALDRVFTGYGDDGPQQEDLNQRGMDPRLTKEFPHLDYIEGCQIVDEGTPKDSSPSEDLSWLAFF